MVRLTRQRDQGKLPPMTGEELKQLREELGWTQEEMAVRLGLRHRSQVHHLETGRTRITGPKLMLLRGIRAELDACRKRQRKGHAGEAAPEEGP